MTGISFRKLSIMVVQEQPFMNETMEKCLQALGFGKIITCRDGEAAFKAFCRESPDIVLTDWNVGSISGVDFIDLIRRDPLSPNRLVPIVMITGYGSMRRVSLAANSGVNSYIIQPFDVERLVQNFTHLINFPKDFIESEEYCGPYRGQADLSQYRR